MKMKCFFMLFIPNIVVDGCHTCRRTRIGCTALLCLHKEPAFQSTPEYNFDDEFLSLSPFAQPNMHFTPESSVRHTSRGDGWRMWMLYSFFEIPKWEIRIFKESLIIWTEMSMRTFWFSLFYLKMLTSLALPFFLQRVVLLSWSSYCWSKFCYIHG